MAIALLSNIPTTHNDDLVQALRRGGTDVRASYLRAPVDEGRPWSVALDADDHIAGGPWGEPRHLRRIVPAADVLLSGRWGDAAGLLRRLVVPRAHPRTVHFWGEGPRPRGGATGVAVGAVRTAWFRAPGLDGVLAVGTDAAAAYRRIVPRRPVHVFPYVTGRGTDVAWRPADHYTVGFAGRLLPRKGLDVALRAVALLPAATRPRFEVLGDGPERAALEQLAADLGLEVAWLGEHDPEAVAAARASWWLQVVPNRSWEGWGMVVHEALNGGVPVAASAHVAAARDLLVDGWNGTVVPATTADDPAAWAEVLRHHADPEVAAEQSGPARATGVAFGPTRAAAWLVELLDRVGAGDDRPGDLVADTWATLPAEHRR